MENIVKLLKRKNVKSEILYEKAVKTEVKFKNDLPYAINIREEEGYGVRVISNGKLGFSSTNKKEELKKIAETALELSKYGERAFFDFPKEVLLPKVNLYHKKIEKVTTSKMLEWGKEIIAVMKEEDPEIKIDLDFVHTSWRRMLVNSRNTYLNMKKEVFYFGVSFMKVTDKGLLQSYEFFNLTDGSEIPTDYIKTWISLEKEFSEKKVVVKDGIYDVIFYPLALSSVLYSPLASGINGINFVKKISPLLTKENQKIADARLSISDDPTIPYKVYSALWDGEGIPHRRNTIIERGVFKGFIFDLQTAGKAGRETTGNSIRRYSTSSNPGTTNLYVHPGEIDFEKMIKDVKKGIVVKEVLGGGMANSLAGEFSVTVSHGYLIENGNITGRVKDLAIAGNLYSLFNQIKAIGKEIKEVPGLIAPWICFEKVRVTSKR